MDAASGLGVPFNQTGPSMTAQIGENLSYEGRSATMCSELLDTYFELAGIDPGFQANCTALWRRYIGTWEIRGGRL
jgi:hypothetical protein